jgi:threonine dehydrogenase-like Zn-dependent dehydrogenase
MRRMRAAFFTGYRAFEVRDVETPALLPGEARVRVSYNGICGSDVSLWKVGVMAGDDRVPGHEFSGVVEEDPTGMLEPGARVAYYPGRGCGECMWCLEGKPRYCFNPPNLWGGYAETVNVLPHLLVPVPDDVDDQGASLSEPFGVALRAIDEAGVREGDLCYVSGLGSIGLLTVAGLIDLGARVVGSDVRDDRRALGEEFGCESTFDPVAEDPFWKLLAVDLHGPRFAFECSGAASAIQLAFNACGHLGTVVLLGIPFEPAMFIPAVMSVKEQRALSVTGPSMASMGTALEVLQRRPEVARVVTGVRPIGEVQQAFEEQAEGTGGIKVLVDPRLG